MSEFEPFPADYFNQSGLNRQHVFDLAELPIAVQEKFAPLPDERQLILFGHGGRRLWEAVQASGVGGQDPIDEYSTQTISHWFASHAPDRHYRILYPGDQPIALQSLGQLAGWHHASPFMVGIDETWGSWSAYRAVLLTDTHFAPSAKVDRNHPCRSCLDTPCIERCPARALDEGRLDLDRCLDFRRQAASPCQYTCLARLACPVGREHRYSDEQIRHVYGISLRWIQGLPDADRSIQRQQNSRRL